MTGWYARNDDSQPSVRLLVSVRNAAEAAVAIRAGVDLVDVKEPRSGPLGAASPRTIAHVLRTVRGRAPASVALGELRDARRVGGGPHRLASLPHTAIAALRYAKFGLAGEAARADWPRRWRGALDQLPPEVAGVAVVYADWRAAAAPHPMRVLREAVQAGCPAVLVDTFDKTAGSLLDHWTLNQIDAFLRAARDAGRLVVLAGSLSAGTLPMLLPLRPDYVAVRRAACGTDRTAAVQADRVAALVGILRAANRRDAVDT